MKGRVGHIDIAKGISITLVAMFHSKLRIYCPEIVEPMSLFRMPLFFLLSGIFFSWTANPKVFLLKKSEALLKPYFSVLLLLLFTSMVAGEHGLISQFSGILYGNADTIRWYPMWFLPHLFAVYVFAYILFRYIGLAQLPPLSIIAIISVFLVIGCIWTDYFWNKNIAFFSQSFTIPGLPFSADIILVSSCYFILGHLLKAHLMNFTPNLWILALSIALFVFIVQTTDAHIDLNRRVYSAPIYATLGALSGIYMIISLSYALCQKHWLSFIPLRIGQASLYILIFHDFIMYKLFSYFSANVVEKSNLVLLAFVCLALAVFIPVAIKWAVERNDLLSLAFLPFKSNKLLQRMGFITNS